MEHCQLQVHVQHNLVDVISRTKFLYSFGESGVFIIIIIIIKDADGIDREKCRNIPSKILRLKYNIRIVSCFIKLYYRGYDIKQLCSHTQLKLLILLRRVINMMKKL